MYLGQLYTFLIFILTGFCIGILFDIFRIFRRSFKTLDFITYVQDMLFWILAGAILLYSIFKFNNGELRGFIFVGIILGVILYLLLLSKYFLKISVKIIGFIKKIIGYPIKVIVNFVNKKIIAPLINFIHKLKIKKHSKFKEKNETQSIE